ncbi:DUF2079 domain-containing protein [Candidatus Roizmanbacteria bacterium]|nr:DUF2079 domain-containing protein [Candidatus Roizmanbacteria bacterium]
MKKILNFFLKYKFEIVLWFFILAYIIYLSHLSIQRYLSLNSSYYDLGIMNQVVYNTARGRFLEMTNQALDKNVSRLATHFDPILAFLAPFYFIYPSPSTLLIIQTIVLAIGAWFIYLISKKTLRNKIYALIFSLSYLFLFLVTRANLFDFHPVALATTFLLAAIYFEIVDKNFLAFVFILLSLLTKEHVGLVTFLYGLYISIFRKKKAFGLFISTISLIFFISTVFFIIPYFRQTTHFAAKYFGDFGDTPEKAIGGILLSPKKLLTIFSRKETLVYLSRFILSYGGLAIFSPFFVLIASPEALINILSANNNMRSLYFHYNSLIVPFLVVGAIFGLRNINKKYKTFFFVIFLILNGLAFYYYSPLPKKLVKEPIFEYKVDEKKLKIIYQLQKDYPDEVRVSSTPRLAPFFTSRHYYDDFLFDPGFIGAGKKEDDIIKEIKKYQKADIIIIDKTEIKGKLSNLFYKHLVDNTSFKRIVLDSYDIEIYKKI